MSDGSILVLQIVGMIGGGIFLIISLILTVALARDERTWLLIILILAITSFIFTFFVDLNASIRWFTIFGIVGVLMIGWLIYLYNLSIVAIEWIIEHRRIILVSITAFASTSIAIYSIVQFDLYNEFFWLLMSILLASVVVGKPPAVREAVLSLTTISVGIIVACVGVYGIGAVVYMSYNYGFGIFLEFGSDQFWLAWMRYVIFTQFAFGFLVVNALILLFIPGLSLPAFGILIMGRKRTQQNDDDFYKDVKTRKETGYW